MVLSEEPAAMVASMSARVVEWIDARIPTFTYLTMVLSEEPAAMVATAASILIRGVECIGATIPFCIGVITYSRVE